MLLAAGGILAALLAGEVLARILSVVLSDPDDKKFICMILNPDGYSIRDCWISAI